MYHVIDIGFNEHARLDLLISKQMNWKMSFSVKFGMQLIITRFLDLHNENDENSIHNLLMK